MSRFNVKQADLASLQAVLSLALSKPFKKSPANVGHSPLPVSETLKFHDQRGEILLAKILIQVSLCFRISRSSVVCSKRLNSVSYHCSISVISLLYHSLPFPHRIYLQRYSVRSIFRVAASDQGSTNNHQLKPQKSPFRVSGHKLVLRAALLDM